MSIKERIDASAITSLQVGIIAICFILNVLDGFDVVAISYAAPAISDDWQMSPALLGTVFSAGLAGMTIGAMFLAPLTDVIGRRKMILLALVLISITMAATGLAEQVWHLIVMRALTGLGIGSMLASLTSMTAEFTPYRRRNFAIGLVQTGYPVGATAGGFIAAWLIPTYGWQGLFYAGGILTGLMIPVVLIGLPESIEFLAKRKPPNALHNINRILTRMQQSPLDSLPEEGRGAVIASATLRSLLTRELRSDTLRLWLSFFMCFLTLYFLLSWVPKIIVDSGMAMERGIQAGIIFNAGAILGVLILGYMADKRGLRTVIFWFSMIGAALMMAFGLAPVQIVILLVLTALIGFFVDGGFSGLYAVAARLYPAEIRTTGVGWAIGAGRFGGILGPWLGGLVIANQWPMALYFSLFALPMVIAAFAVTAIKTRALDIVP